MDYDGHVTNTGASGSMPPSEKHKESTHLSNSIAPRSVSPGQASSSAFVSPSYASFLHTLVNSGSDKTYMFQKQYRKELGTISEATNECDFSEEKVDYEGSDSEDAATSIQYINPGQGILALAVPTLQQAGNAAMVPDEGDQSEVDGTQEDPLSQVDNPVGGEINEPRFDASLSQAGGDTQPMCMSTRLMAQDSHSTKIPDKAIKHATARDVPGTNLTSHNSFALLDDDAIHERALEMGINPETFTMENINYLKDLEHARHAIAIAHTGTEPEDESDTERILLLGFDKEQGCEDEDGFTPVLSRKKRKKRRSLINSGRRREPPSKSGGSPEGAQSKSSAALGKVNNAHPLSGIVTGTRCRKRNPKYL
jgi:hypothetical protein